MLSAILYIVLGYALLLLVFVLGMLWTSPAPRVLAQNQNRFAGAGATFSTTTEREHFTISHCIEDGIERIIYTPKHPRHETPILMAHGMWHGAWCWGAWQEALAERGWQSIAFSLPGHGKSPVQRPITLCTLSYYLAFLRDEVQRLPHTPILMGHSMGGALTQWHLKYVTDHVPAVVLVAPWVSHSILADCTLPLIRLDPLTLPLTAITWNAANWMRSPQAAASKLITAGADLSPEELHARLGPESALVVCQHNPPFWQPAQNISTPMLLLAGEQDALIPLANLERSAAHYHADFVAIPQAGHNLMMEHNQRQTLERVADWLEKKGLS